MNRALTLALLVALSASGYSQSSLPETPIKTTLCEIKAHPENFQHKLVEFSATASHGFEDSMVESSDCPWGKEKNPGVWMEFGGTQSTDIMYCCGFTPKPDRPSVFQLEGIEVPLVDDDLFRGFNAALHPVHPRQRKSDTVEAVLRGRIFTQRYKIAPNATNVPEIWGGYGHMGCCMLFVVTQVVSIGKTGTRPN